MNHKLLALVCTAILITGCSRPEQTIKVLEEQGYTDIETTGYRLFRCSEDDWFITGFEATSPSGKRVSGTACKGVFKGTTLRFD